MNWGIDMNDNEKLWAGQFGDAYHERNQMKSRLEFWTRVIGKYILNINSVTEFGAGKGDNLIALSTLIPTARFSGVEINKSACDHMRDHGIVTFNQPVNSLHRITPTQDLIISRGFLIHVPESQLNDVFEIMFRSCARYIVIAEYYSPERREINYRGYPNALWTDDYAGKLMAKYPRSLKLLDYGFMYHRCGGDDLTWFLLEKTK